MIKDTVQALRVLAVDDHQIMRTMIQRNLEKMGFKHIETAIHGGDALEKIKNAKESETPFNIIFLDWHMPDVQGIEVLTHCRNDTSFDKTAIIMLTAEQEEHRILEAMQAGATAYLIKPASYEALEKNVSDILIWLEKQGVELETGESDFPPPEKKEEFFPNDLSKELEPIIAESLNSIFSNMFQAQIVPSGFSAFEQSNNLICIGRLRQDSMILSLRFCFDQELLRPLLKNLYSEEYLQEGDIYIDTACEIVNILCSQIKAYLNNKGYNLLLDLPQPVEESDLDANESSVMNIYFSLNNSHTFLIDVKKET